MELYRFGVHTAPEVYIVAENLPAAIEKLKIMQNKLSVIANTKTDRIENVTFLATTETDHDRFNDLLVV